MIRSKEELIASISKMIGDSAEDDGLHLLEDVADTMDSLSDGENWKQKYEDNDREWRQKYKDRFLTTVDEQGNVDETEEPEEPNVKSFDELFTYS